MRLQLKTAPTIEPVDLEETKNYLRVDAGVDNALISALITAARQLAEKETHRAFITQTWLLTMDSAEGEIEIPKPPLQSIVSIKGISTIESSVDQNSVTGAALLYVVSTTGFAIDDTIVINRDGEREESGVVLSIQTGVSLTLTTNLTKDHTAILADRVEKYILADLSSYNIDASENSYGRIKLKSGYVWPSHRGFASFIIEFKAGYGDLTTDVPAALTQVILEIVATFYEERQLGALTKEHKALLWPWKILRI